MWRRLRERWRLRKLLGLLLCSLRRRLLKLRARTYCRRTCAYRRAKTLVGIGMKSIYCLLRFWIVWLKLECLAIHLQSLFLITSLLHGDAKVVPSLCVCWL